MNAKKKRTKIRRRARKLADQAWEAADDGNYDLAVKIVRRAVDLDPANPVYWNDQGMLLNESGEPAKAADAFQAAISLAPDFAEAYSHLAEIRIRQGLVREAVALQQAATRFAPESIRYAEALAAYQAMAGHVASSGAISDDGQPGVSAPETCPIERSLRSAYPAIAQSVDAVDWNAAESSLTEEGYAEIHNLLDEDICRALRVMYHEDSLFSKSVVMNKDRFGSGSYRYFAAPIPKAVDAIRRIVYPRVARVANHWQQLLGDDDSYPTAWEGFRIHCARSDQTSPTPLLLRYEAGGFNDLHRDIRGEVFFPIQLAIVLSPQCSSPEDAGDCFHGGEFLFCDDPARKKPDRREIPAGLGDAILFCTRARLVPIAGTYGWQPVKHGVQRVVSGTRYVLGVPFHEYR